MSQNTRSVHFLVADLRRQHRHDRFVPTADFHSRAKRAGLRVEMWASAVERPPIPGEGY